MNQQRANMGWGSRIGTTPITIEEAMVGTIPTILTIIATITTTTTTTTTT